MKFRTSRITAAIACVFAAGELQANPTGPTVVAGQATLATAGGSLSITNSPGAIIQWQGFSIGAGETTRFIQPSAASSVLNRVIGPDPSLILGTLVSNGRVFLINPSGILVGEGARIDVAGLVASTLNLSNQDFLGGKLNFAAAASAGKVENRGSITTPTGGSVYLIGSNVANSGIIRSAQGEVILAAGQSVKILDSSTPGVRVEVTAGDSGGVNLGEILAQSGQIGIFGAALAASSSISVDALESGNGGRIIVRSSADTSVAGTLSARGGARSGDGGFIETSGKHVAIDPGTRVDTLAPHGATGLWLLDPVDYTIGAAGDETPGAVTISLATSNRLISATNDITVADALTWTTAQTLELDAGHDVRVNAAITASTAGAKIILTAGNDVSVNAAMTASGGGSMLLRANHDVLVGGVLTADTGLDAVVLRADNDGSGPGAAGGTVVFSGIGAVITPRTVIRFNPAGYTNTDAEIASYATKVSAILDAKAWVFVQGDNKVYDGNTTAVLSFKGTPTDGGAVTLTPGTADFDTRNAGTAKTVTYGGYALGLGTTKFELFSSAGTTSADITAKALTASVAAPSKAYDGDMSATPTLSITAGLVGTETVIATGSATFNTKDVLTANLVTVNSVALANGLNGGVASNYSLAAGQTVVDSITPRPLTGSVTAANKVYDANTSATLLTRTLSGQIGGDAVSYNGGTATFADKDAATGKTVTGTGLGLSGADAANYSVNSIAITTADITPAPLGIAANSTTKIYGSTVSFAGTEFSSTGLKAAETIGGVSLASAGAAATAGVAGSPYAIVPSAPTGGTFSAGNYSITFTNGALGVTPAPLGIAANSATRLYGDANPAFSATYSGFQNGETAATLSGALALAAAAIPTSNVGNYAIVPSGQSSTNYSITYTNGALGVTPAPLGIAANSATRLYGDANPAFSATYSGFRNGESAAALTGALALVTAAVPSSNVGSYAITPSGQSSTNYAITYVNGALGVTPAPLGVAANSASKTFGDTLSFSGTEFTSSGLKNAETIGSVSLVSAGAAPAAGVAGSPYPITASAATGGSFSAGNYAITYVDGSLGVIPAGLLGIAANAAVKTYDGLPFTGGNGVSYTGFQGADTAASLTGALVYGGSSQGAINAGNYVIVPSGQSSTNYTITYVNGALGVIAAPLGIAANSATRLYGDANPAFSATYGGFRNGETSAVLAGALALATSAAPASNVGSYAIVPSGQSSTNYSITYVNGALGVTAAPLGIASNSNTKTYGSTLSFTGSEFTSAGLKNAETIGSVSLVSAGAAATAGVASSPYAITASAAGGGSFNAANYSISYVDGALGVTRAPLGIAANSATRLYGDANPALGATYSGFQNGDTAAALTGALALGTAAVPTSSVASYAVVPSGQSSTNYSIAYVNGALGVIAAPLMVSADAKSKVYGTTDPAMTFATIGLKNADTAGTVFSGALTRAGGQTVMGGSYSITQGTLAANSNYTVSSFTGSTLVITPAPLAVAANAQTKVYGTGDPAMSFATTGLVLADTAAGVLSGALARAGGETVMGGPYAITQGTLAANGNYTLGSFTGSSLAITPAPLTVAANPQSKVFGATDPALTYGMTPLVNSAALGIADTAAAVLSGALTRAAGESALGGPYAITQGSLAAGSNYTLGFTASNLIITGAAAEPTLGFNAGQVVFAGVINNETYYRPGNFWHISLNANNADPGFDVMRGTDDSSSLSRRRSNSCDSVFGGGFCETWAFPQQLERP